MTWRKRTITEMAQEAGIIALNVECDPSYLPIIERFAALVREDERNRTWTQQHWTDYERSIAAAEREACAKVCAEDGLLWGQRYAAAIRARGEK